MKKIEMNLDETQTNSKETVSVSKAASAVLVSHCGVKWRKLSDSDFAEKMCVMTMWMTMMKMLCMMKMMLWKILK